MGTPSGGPSFVRETSSSGARGSRQMKMMMRRAASCGPQLFQIGSEICPGVRRRDSPRRRSDIEPRTLTSRRRGEVSHPLPGSGAFAGDVVARVHSLGAEGRKRQARGAEACCLSAARAHWAVGAVRLVDAGGVALFVAFLSNELGALRASRRRL